MGLEEKQQDRELEARNFRARPVAWGVGRPALVKLIAIVSPILAGVFRAGNSREMSASLFEALPGLLTDADVQYFARIFGDASWVQDGENWAPLVEQNQPKYFEGEYLSFLRWLLFCMEVNFGGFFGGVMKGGVGGDLLKKMMPSSK